MEKIEHFIKWMRWKAFFYEEGSNQSRPKNYGLKSLSCPPKSKNMTNFENDLTNLLKTIRIRVTKSSLQQQLTEDKNYKEHQDNFNICGVNF